MAEPTIGYVPDTQATLPPAPPTVDGLPASAGRIELRGELARGGMGAVLRGHDPALNREVAVKVLLAPLTGRPDLVRRFVEEAQVAGQLQHPGVVPIYDLGSFTDGRPFFAMKLVQGRTLAELLAERPTLSHDLPRFLNIFESVCQAMAYAHSRRIIHRDLKPLNVMVGAFGEVQVMDWGIAKVLTDSDENNDHPVDGTTKPVGKDSSLTAAGSTLGTLAYMPPEQAAGEPVNERADVFGLGAMLCEILTGKPPYVGSSEQVLWQAASAELTEPFSRLAQSGAEAELIAIAQSCLAADRDRRPRNAGEVASAVTNYLTGVQDRLRNAELDRAAAETKAEEEQKRRRVQFALAGTVLLAVIGAAGVGFWVQRDRATRAAELAQQQADTEQRVAVAVQRATLLESQQHPAEALAAAEQARELTNDPRVTDDTRSSVAAMTAAFKAEADAAERDRRLIDQLQDASDIAENRFAPFAGPAGAQREYLVYHFQYLFRFWGADIQRDRDDEIIARSRARPPSVRRQLAAGLDQWAGLARVQGRPKAFWRRLTALAASVDPESDPIRAELRALRSGNPPATQETERRRLQNLADRADPAITATMMLLATELQNVGEADRAIEVLRVAVRARPGEVLLHERLAHVLIDQSPPRWADALPYLQTARALRPRLGARLAMVLSELGKIDEALAVCRATESARPDPGTPYLRAAQVLAQLDKTDQSLPFFRAAARLEADDRNIRYFLAAALERHGEYAAAVTELEAAVNLPPIRPPLGGEDQRWIALERLMIDQVQKLLADCRRLAALESRAPAVLAGTGNASPAERCEMAFIAARRERWRDAARLYADAFAADPHLAEPVNSKRYDAACVAVLAAANRNSGEPDEAECARLRGDALRWLRAEFAAVQQKFDSKVYGDRAEALRLLRHWQSDRDLASVREEALRNRLPAAERDAWTALWGEVEAAIKAAAEE